MRKRICPKCGDKFSISTYVCPNCGQSLSNAVVVEVEDIHIDPITHCSNCGNTVRKGTRTCSACGEFIARTQVSSKRVSFHEEKSGGSNTFLCVLSFLIPIVGIIAGAILLTNDDEYKKSVGKGCVILGICSAILWGALAAFTSSMYR